VAKRVKNPAKLWMPTRNYCFGDGPIGKAVTPSFLLSIIWRASWLLAIYYRWNVTWKYLLFTHTCLFIYLLYDKYVHEIVVSMNELYFLKKL